MLRPEGFSPGIGTNLTSFHVLEIHSDLRSNAFTEPQVGGDNLTLVRSDSSVVNHSQSVPSAPRRRTLCHSVVELESRTFSIGLRQRLGYDGGCGRRHPHDTGIGHAGTR